MRLLEYEVSAQEPKKVCQLCGERKAGRKLWFGHIQVWMCEVDAGKLASALVFAHKPQESQVERELYELATFEAETEGEACDAMFKYAQDRGYILAGSTPFRTDAGVKMTRLMVRRPIAEG